MKKLLLSVAIAALVPAAAAHAEGFKKSAGDILVRGRAIAVLPDENADLSGAVTGNDQLSIDNEVVPELDLTYFITDNIGIEVIAAVTPHNVTGKGAVAGIDFGKVWLLPPTVTVQYHFDPIEAVGGISPYVGAGLNYTAFFGEDDWGSAVQDVDYDSSWGGALQAGVDIPVGGNWVVNADVKKIWINSDVDVTLAGSGAHVAADTDINPWVVGVGVGYKF